MVNKLALLRYKIIDQCLQNRYRKWTLEDLMEAVSNGLYEYEGITSGVSKRTLQLDIQNMRSDKLGYHAPIVVTEKKFYSYNEKGYSIVNANLSKQDAEKLGEVLKLLKQFVGFSYFEDLSATIGKIEGKLLQQQKSTKIAVDFEKNELLKGLEWLDILLDAVKTKKTLAIDYQSFKAKKPNRQIFSPYLLKEYRNRWFILGKNKQQVGINLLALDRIIAISESPSPFVDADFEVSSFFEDVIGVTKNVGQKGSAVVLSFVPSAAPYVLTKPLHASQKVLKSDDTQTIIQINVIHNYELEREILGFGESVKVLSPRYLSNRIVHRLRIAVGNYENK